MASSYGPGGRQMAGDGSAYGKFKAMVRQGKK